MTDTGIPGLSGRPRLPEHLMASVPTNLAATQATPEVTDKIVNGFIQGLQTLEQRCRIKVKATKDELGWDIRIDLPQ